MLQLASFLLIVFFGLGIFLIGRELSKKIGIYSLALFFLTFEVIFNNFNFEEMISSFFALYAVYFFLRFFQKKNKMIVIFLSGVFAGLAFMSKQATVGIFPSFFLSLLLFKNYRANLNIRTILFFIFGSLATIFPVFFYYFINHALGDFVYWNFIFNLTIYPKFSTPYAIREGVLMGSWLLGLTVCGFFLLWKGKFSDNVKFNITLLILLSVFLLPAILPSILSYKILIIFPYPLIIGAISIAQHRTKLIFTGLFLSLLLFLPAARQFYIDYVPQNLSGGYITDYGDDEVNVVEWLNKNIPRGVKIMNVGNSYITFAAKRLPANKYVYIFPWLVYPYGKSTEEIVKSSPRVVVLDTQVIDGWPILKTDWGFIRSLNKNYNLRQQFGTYKLYELK